MTAITTFTSVLVNKLQDSSRECFDFPLDPYHQVLNSR
jgi:hypothetical protein